MSEINEGVRILVERMKTNPEEFHEGLQSKWAHVVSRATGAGWLTEEERKLLDDAANEVQRDKFTADVLKTLTREDDPYASAMEAKQMYINPAQMKMAKSLMGSGGVATTTGTGAITNSTLTVGGSPVATQADIARAIAKLEGGKVFK